MADGDGSRLLAPGLEITNPNGDSWEAIAAGNFNDDGMADTVWQVAGTNRMTFYSIHGTRLFIMGRELQGHCERLPPTLAAGSACHEVYVLPRTLGNGDRCTFTAAPGRLASGSPAPILIPPQNGANEARADWHCGNVGLRVRGGAILPRWRTTYRQALKQEAANVEKRQQMKTTRWLMALMTGFVALLPALGDRSEAFASNRDAGHHAGDSSREDIEAADIVVAPNIQINIANSIAIAVSALGNAAAVAKSSSVSGPGKLALAQSIGQATTLVGTAYATANSTALTRRGAGAVADSLSDASSVIGDAIAQSQSSAISQGGPAVANSLSRANTSVGDALAVASSVASN
jgi:hypothetical protein